ncbi:MAG: outer membrane protein assembly factor BamE [Bdellovibrionales bacterium]|nr:outer membrane protein assembly factor BamE [Bdellovibrionales bacterium]
MMRKLAALFFTGILLSACSTFFGAENSVNLSRLERGMSQQRVLSLLGHPDSVIRENGMDRWIYQFRKSENRGRNSFVDFSEGAVVRTGELSGRDIAASSEESESGTCTRWVSPEFRFESLCLH